ncbi:uncharacterized protein LOC110077679 isoform X1 [Pogona vitticeps]
MDPTLNASKENPEALMKGACLKTKTSPVHNTYAQDDVITRDNIQPEIGKESAMKELLVQITDWDSQTLPNQDEGSLKRSRYRIGGSADNVISLTSCQSLLPLEWKVLRSSRSQDTLAYFSGNTQEGTDGGYKLTSDNNQDIVEDIIGDEVAFKVCRPVLSHNQNAAYTTLSKTAFPTVPIGSPSSEDVNCLKQSSDGLPCMTILCPRTEKWLEIGTQVNQAQSPAVDQQDSSLINHIRTTAASSKNLQNASASPVSECHSSNHESAKTGESPVLSEFLLKSRIERKQEHNQPMKKMQTESQLLLQGQSLHLADDAMFYRKEKDVLNEEEPSLNLLKSECKSPIILQRLIVDLKSQINNLQEANKTAVLELAKADEEISQLKNGMAWLKSDYLQQLAEYKEENLILKRKINRIQNRYGPIDTYEQVLHEEICELRDESRRLREISHHLNEENHRLKEELRDVKRQYEWLTHTITGKQDERRHERSRNNTSPSSLNSESTDVLIAGYQDTGLAKESGDLKDDLSEETITGIGNNASDINLYKETIKANSKQDVISTLVSLSQADTTSRYSPKRSHTSRRPFAPRSTADLKVGNLVKFSCPAGKISKGTIKYLGPLFGREDSYLGIELEGDQVGRHDGIFEGTRYFLCEPNKGVFVNFNKVIIAWE